MSDPELNIDDLLTEDRVFEPPAAFTADALVADPAIYERAAADPEAFWAEQASLLDWYTKWDTVMEWTPPWVKWFVGGTLNVSFNCLDRHIQAGGGEKVAYYWEGEPGDKRTDHVPGPLRGDLPVRQRPQVDRRPQGRPGRHLPGDGPRTARRHAGLRPDRRARTPSCSAGSAPSR